jgi:hypothetical protein
MDLKILCDVCKTKMAPNHSDRVHLGDKYVMYLQPVDKNSLGRVPICIPCLRRLILASAHKWPSQ